MEQMNLEKCQLSAHHFKTSMPDGFANQFYYLPYLFMPMILSSHLAVHTQFYRPTCCCRYFEKLCRPWCWRAFILDEV